MTGKAIFFDAITAKRGIGFEFEVWYANHYLPAIAAAVAWQKVRRYGSPALGTYLAVFEASSVVQTQLPQPQHEAVIDVERYTAVHIGEMTAAAASPDIVEADILYPVTFNVPLEREAEFDRWYMEEHLNILLGSPYWPMCRRYKVIDPGPGSATHIALHYLTDLRALESEERTRARTTPWRDRLAAEAWFRGEYRVFHRVATATQR